MAQPHVSAGQGQDTTTMLRRVDRGIYFMDIAPASLLTETAKEAKEEKTRALQTRK